MYRTLILVFFGLFSAVFAGCQSGTAKTESKAAKRYPIGVTRYYVRYIAEKKELQAEVNFQLRDKDGGLPSKYFFADAQMQIKKLPEVGTTFRYIAAPATFASPFVFRYTELDGQEQRDSVALPLLLDVRFGSKNLSLSKGGILVWTGPALEATDLLRIILTDAKGETTTINHVGITPQGQLPLPLEQIATLPLGKAICAVSLTRATASEHIIRRVEYYFEDFEVEIVK
jgi:hypothetical protein